MRQIKFRAWDNHYKRWLTAEAVGLNVKLNPVGRGCFSILPLDRFIDISQSTGLTDKNGKEIYEGDKWLTMRRGKRLFLAISVTMVQEMD